MEEPTDMFHPWSQKHIFDYNQAIKEEILAAGDVRLKCKQMTLRVIASCTAYNKIIK